METTGLRACVHFAGITLIAIAAFACIVVTPVAEARLDAPGTVLRLPMPVKALYAAGVVRDAAEKIDHRLAPSTPVAEAPTAAHGAYVANACIGCHGANLASGKIPGAPPDRGEPGDALRRAEGAERYRRAGAVPAPEGAAGRRDAIAAPRGPPGQPGPFGPLSPGQGFSAIGVARRPLLDSAPAVRSALVEAGA